MAMVTLEPLLTEAEAAELLGISQRSMAYIRHSRQITYLAMPRPRYRREDVEEYRERVRIAKATEEERTKKAVIEAEERARVKYLRRSLRARRTGV